MVLYSNSKILLNFQFNGSLNLTSLNGNLKIAVIGNLNDLEYIQQLKKSIK